MECTLNFGTHKLEIFKRLLKRKDENIYYEEEQVISAGNTLEKALDKITAEGGEPFNGGRLIIIDKYFTLVACDFAEHYTNTLLQWIDEKNITKVDIYSDLKNNCFESKCKEKFDPILKLHQIPSKIHDRFWIVKKVDEIYGLQVGTSLNGLGKKLCLVNRILPEDTEVLLEILREKGIDV